MLPLVGREIPIVADELRPARVRHRRPQGHAGPRRPTTSRSAAATASPAINVIGEDGRMTDGGGRAPTPASRPPSAQARVVEDLRAAGPAARRGALHPHGPVLPPLRRARGAARLAAVVLRHDPPRRSRPSPRSRRGGCASRPPKWGEVYLDWMREIRPVVRQPPALVGPPAAGLLPRRRGATSAGAPPRARAGSATRTSSTPGSARRCGRSPPSAGPSRPPSSRRSTRPQVLSTARDIIFLWVARMVMMGIEYMGEEPFSDVYIHSVVQAPDGRRMSKSLGTGIDPIEHHREPRRRRPALRPADDVEHPGRALLRRPHRPGPPARHQALERGPPGASTAAAAAGARRPAARRRSPTAGSRRASPAAVEQAASADRGLPALAARRPRLPPGLRRLLRLVPRAAEGRARRPAEVAGHALEQLLALAHPLMPFVTEECWSRTARRRAACMATHAPARRARARATPRPRPRSPRCRRSSPPCAPTAPAANLPPRTPLVMSPAAAPVGRRPRRRQRPRRTDAAADPHRRRSSPTAARSLVGPPPRSGRPRGRAHAAWRDELATATGELERAEAQAGRHRASSSAPRPTWWTAEREKAARYAAEREALAARIAALGSGLT